MNRDQTLQERKLRVVCVTCPMTTGQADHMVTLARMSPQISLENDYLGPRRIDALKKEDLDWQKKAQEAVLNIQEFTVKYFEITARAQKGRVCLSVSKRYARITHVQIQCQCWPPIDLREVSIHRAWTQRRLD